MNYYQLCPLCKGQGHVEKPPGIPGDVYTWTSSTASHRCRMCLGMGFIPIYDIDRKNAEHNDEPIEIPIKQKKKFKIQRAT